MNTFDWVAIYDRDQVAQGAIQLFFKPVTGTAWTQTPVAYKAGHHAAHYEKDCLFVKPVLAQTSSIWPHEAWPAAGWGPLPAAPRAGYTRTVSTPHSHRVTELVHRLGDGDPAVAEELLPLVYEELRLVAHGLFQRQPRGHTLQPTALVHEAWLKIAGSNKGLEGRSHFFSVAARAMRQVLTDHARAQRTERRGNGWQSVTLDDSITGKAQTYDLVDLDDALQRLAKANERHARVAELRLFADLSTEEIAAALDLTPRTIQLDWRAARAFLRHVLEDR